MQRKRGRHLTDSAPGPVRTKPVRSIGRYSTLHYCPDCGQKRDICRCVDTDREATVLAQIESRFRL